jgi:hypothetical protein
MKKSLLLSFFVAISLVGGACLSALAADHHSSSSSPRPGKGASSNQTYVVVQIGEEYKVLDSSRINDEKKDLKKKYEEKMKEWQDLRKSDPKLERPVRLNLRIIKSGFKTQKGADEYRQTLEEKDTGKDKTAKPLAPHGR